MQSMGWGIMNVTGPLLAWSFTAELPTVPVPHVRPPRAAERALMRRVLTSAAF